MSLFLRTITLAALFLIALSTSEALASSFASSQTAKVSCDWHTTSAKFEDPFFQSWHPFVVVLPRFAFDCELSPPGLRFAQSRTLHLVPAKSYLFLAGISPPQTTRS